MTSQNFRIFLDSNVILSGLLSSKGAPRILLDLLCLGAPGLKGLTGEYNLEEINRNLKKKFPELILVFDEYLPKLNLEMAPFPPIKDVLALANGMPENDAPVLAAAKIANADYLITGDKNGFPKKLAEPVIIITPRLFLDIFAKQLSEQQV